MENRAGIIDARNERNYGIDSLRIVSMFMVVLVHLLGHGGLAESVEKYSLEFFIVYLLGYAAKCSVDCFVLISGYVGIFAKHRYSSLAQLWLKVLFYSVGITLIFELLRPEVVGKKNLILSFFPILSNQYWYFTSYFFLFLFMPFLNAAINNVGRKRLLLTLSVIVLLTSVVYPLTMAAAGSDYLRLSGGYSVLWFMILYLVGAYIRKYGFLRNVRRIWFILSFVVSVILTLGSKLAIGFFSMRIFSTVKYDSLYTHYQSVTILISALSLLLIFERTDFKGVWRKIIAAISPLSFGVYLIHDNNLIRENLIKDRFAGMAEYPAVVMALSITASALCVFAVCIGIDGIRELLFRVLGVRSRLERLEERLRKRIGNRKAV